jgi:hypothetical protein
VFDVLALSRLSITEETIKIEFSLKKPPFYYKLSLFTFFTYK